MPGGVRTGTGRVVLPVDTPVSGAAGETRTPTTCVTRTSSVRVYHSATAASGSIFIVMPFGLANEEWWEYQIITDESSAHSLCAFLEDRYDQFSAH